MKLVADAVNREYSLGQSPLPALYNTVSSVMFVQNMVALRKQTEVWQLHAGKNTFLSSGSRQNKF